MGVMIAIYVVILSFLTYGLFVPTAQTEVVIWGFLGLFGMSIFVSVIYVFGRNKSLAEEAYLVEFLQDILTSNG